jgi:hypothetical protein
MQSLANEATFVCENTGPQISPTPEGGTGTDCFGIVERKLDLALDCG